MLRNISFPTFVGPTSRTVVVEPVNYRLTITYAYYFKIRYNSRI